MSEIKCYACGEEMKKEITEVKSEWGKYELIIKGVEAYVCPNCGEEVYDREEMHMIQNLSESLSEQSEDNRPEVLNVKEVADLLRVTEQTVYNMIRDGRLKAVKMGREWRFMRQDIESILNPDNEEGTLAARGDMSSNDKETIQKVMEDM